MLKNNFINHLSILITALLFCLQVFADPGKPNSKSGINKPMGKFVTTADLLTAIQLVDTSSNKPNVNFSEYRLINAQQLLSGSKHCSSPRCWRLTYKQARLIPNKITDKTGAGGEIFFIVDLDEEKLIFTGFGE